MSYANIDELFGNFKVNTADVTLASGAVVKVRGLTRFELLENSKDVTSSHEIEAHNVSTCMLEPTMTFDQVVEWQKHSAPGDIGKVTTAIRDLSGLGEAQPKSDVSGDAGDGS